MSKRLEEEPIPSFNAEGRRFTAELYLEMLSGMPLSFDYDGNWDRHDLWQENLNPHLMASIQSAPHRRLTLVARDGAAVGLRQRNQPFPNGVTRRCGQLHASSFH